MHRKSHSIMHLKERSIGKGTIRNKEIYRA
jgi:hypothetical protein